MPSHLAPPLGLHRWHPLEQRHGTARVREAGTPGHGEEPLLHVPSTGEAVRDAGDERTQHRAHQPCGARELSYARQLFRRHVAREVSSPHLF